MHNSSDAGPVAATPGGDIRQLIADDLRHLIGRIEASLRLIDAAKMQDADGDQPGSIDVVVLDDVTPGCVTASTALLTCRAGLDLALQCLSESGNPHAAARQRHLVA